MSDGFIYKLVPGSTTRFGATFEKRNGGGMFHTINLGGGSPAQSPSPRMVPICTQEIRDLIQKSGTTSLDARNNEQFNRALKAIESIIAQSAASPQPGHG